mmetsp:Transcript_92764/g.276712  ORF Transcript_92764/g.276712 Transcript_92764/m.276712 type:complete len:230 (-) Transcript_92764:1258-1947(-)
MTGARAEVSLVRAGRPRRRPHPAPSSEAGARPPGSRLGLPALRRRGGGASAASPRAAPVVERGEPLPVPLVVDVAGHPEEQAFSRALQDITHAVEALREEEDEAAWLSRHHLLLLQVLEPAPRVERGQLLTAQRRAVLQRTAEQRKLAAGARRAEVQRRRQTPAMEIGVGVHRGAGARDAVGLGQGGAPHLFQRSILQVVRAVGHDAAPVLCHRGPRAQVQVCVVHHGE